LKPTIRSWPIWSGTTEALLEEVIKAQASFRCGVYSP
jgi:hypothetical protein